MDIGDNKKRIRSLSRQVRNSKRAKSRKDQDQDAAIEALQSEVDELKLALAVLTEVLVASGQVKREELERIDELMDEAERSEE